MFRSRGCLYCGGKGFSGRLGLFEFLSLDETWSHTIASGAQESDLFNEKGMERSRLLPFARDYSPTYPVIVLVAALGVTAFMIVGVIPKLLVFALAAARGQTPNDRNQLLKELRLGSSAPISAAPASGPRDPTNPDPRLLDSLRGSPTGNTARILIDAQSQAAVKPADRMIELIEMQRVTFTEAANGVPRGTGRV